MPKQAITLFEYHNVKIDALMRDTENQEAFQETCTQIDAFLQEIWERRPKQENFYTEDAPQLDSKQKFISFMQDKIQAQNYVGVIHYEDWTINMLPKIFNTKDGVNNTEDTRSEAFVRSCYDHILWWLSYCQKIRFPDYKDSLASSKADFFEILIYLFSSYTSKILNELVYQCYVEMEDETTFIKGRLNTPAYIRENISTGRWHKFQCVYEEFTIDNTFNRIVKYVARMLFAHTKDADNKTYLAEILFLLDEVSDEPATSEDCMRIHFNIMYDELKMVLDYCKLFLDHCISFNYKDELQLFAFLLPMEKVFEDFIAGFMQKHLPLNVQFQKTDCLAQINEDESRARNIYQIKPDLYIECGQGKNIIADTKYKMVYLEKKGTDTKISQSDLYQMLAYAVRFKVDDIKLLYPIALDEIDPHNRHISHTQEFSIKDEFSDTKIKITPHKLPIINAALKDNYEAYFNKTIREKFEETESALKQKLEDIFV